VSTIIQEYLDNVKNNLTMEASDEMEVISELSDHIEDEIQELKQHGFRDEEAACMSIRLLGSAKMVAHQIYEAHSQGSWQQALFACLPHVLFGLVFLLNWWRGIGAVLIMLVLIVGTSVYGWWRHKSSWLFPWLGYSLLPVVAAGLSLLYLPRALAWIAVLVYIPLALWLILRIVSQTIKRDWVYISLMFLPIPVILSWFLAAGLRLGFSGFIFDRMSYFGPWIGTSFLALALAVVSFTRVRKRWLKIAVLFITSVTTIALIYFYAWGQIDLVSLLLLIIFLCSIFFIPALLANGAKSGKWGKIFEHHPMS
jgi:hypothetical protein